MTVEKVGEFKVIAVEPVIRRGKVGGGSPNPLVDKLTLDNGEKVYGCKLCTYTTANTGGMHGHLTRHHRDAQRSIETIQAQPAKQEAAPEPTATEEPSAPVQAPIVKAVMDMSVGALLSYVAFLESNGERPEALRERVEAAEARVAELEEKFAKVKAFMD